MTRTKELRLVRDLRVDTEVLIASISRWLAKKEVQAKDPSKRWDPVHLSNHTTFHLLRNKPRLRMEARVIIDSTGERM